MDKMISETIDKEPIQPIQPDPTSQTDAPFEDLLEELEKGSVVKDKSSEMLSPTGNKDQNIQLPDVDQVDDSDSNASGRSHGNAAKDETGGKPLNKRVEPEIVKAKKVVVSSKWAGAKKAGVSASPQPAISKPQGNRGNRSSKGNKTVKKAAPNMMRATAN